MATSDQLRYSKEYKQHERATNPTFRAKEKVYRKRWAKKMYHKSKLAREYVQTCPTEFARFLRSKGVSEQLIRVTLGITSDISIALPAAQRMPETPIQQPVQQREYLPAPVLPPSVSVPSSDRRVLSAQEMERIRMGAASNPLTQLGIRMD
jgi:hypothetical protein